MTVKSKDIIGNEMKNEKFSNSSNNKRKYRIMKKYFLLIIFLLISCKETKEVACQQQTSESEYIHFLSTIKLPTQLDFCGEMIPLDIPEVRERAEREFYILLQQPGQIILYLKRSGKYFSMFERILKEENVPDDLKYLSVAESALYMARSPKNAVGLWQFIPETGRSMGLIIDDLVDERCHPEKSTKAAIKYLKDGYSKFKSWTLASAGYNMGHVGVSENLKFQDVKDFFDLFLNEETSRYILRIVIIKEIMKNPAKYGFHLKQEEFYNTDKYKTISYSSSIENLSDWAKQNGTTYKDVKLLNPWILKRLLPSPPKSKNWEIAVPEK